MEYTILALIINLLLSVWIIPKYMGSKRRIGYWWSMLACFFLTPLVGLIITLFSPRIEFIEFDPDYIKESEYPGHNSIRPAINYESFWRRYHFVFISTWVQTALLIILVILSISGVI